MSFVHLHNHSHYSLLDGLTKLDELINYAKEQGSPAVALTDHGTMYGIIEFYQKAKKAGIKPILGVETYLAPKSRFDKNTKFDATNYHLLLLAKNNTGYKNLIKLISAAHIEGFYYKPRIDWELLKKYHEGLIASSACLGGEISQLILADKLEEAKKRILEYNELFGQDNYYLEIMDHPELEGQEKVNKQMIKFSKELGIPLVATNDVHYLKKEDAEAQDILLCLQNKKKIGDIDRMKMIGSGDYSMRSNKEMIEAFSHVPEAIENTLKIAEKCNVEIDLGHIQLPYFEVPEGETENSYLQRLCEEGIEKRYKGVSEEKLKEVKKRLEYELGVIFKMGWSSYFLIVADFVSWAKKNNIVVGPGRGSAPGSIVCHLTGITSLDPLKYDLLFERFLNPERISMPDIDLDFADVRREEVIKYVEHKYGKDHVAQIITFGTMAARAAIRDVGRVLDEPYEYCDKLSKSVPMFMKLGEALKTVPELKEMYNNEPAAKKILDYAQRLEGVARHASTHACGVLITKKPLTEYVPIQYASSVDKSVISQYSLHPIEDLGLLKMDFLGLKNLTIIESALKIIKNTRGLEIDIDKISLDDKLTYQLFQKGETTGVFQFESSGMKRYLKELKPSEFEDIIAMVALYRPGPMEWIPDYIAGKHQEKKITYLHPKLEPILKNTYGVAIYQEQVMRIARDLAGFSMGEADVLRKAMGKKIASLLAEQKEKFIDGCVKNNIAKELAEKVFSFIEPFAGYGFNRSHAASYAMIAYQTAYLKAHWPTEFMAALLTADQHDNDRIAIEIDECRKMKIKIMPPDINESFSSFTVVTEGTKENKSVDKRKKLDTIRFGLKAIKNVGGHIVEELIKERKANGPYRNISDLLERVTDKDLNHKSLESLIKSGALDAFASRGQLLANLDRLLSFNKEMTQKKNSNQTSLFANNADILPGDAITLIDAPEIRKEEKLAWEKELLGLYISEHPFSSYLPYLDNYIIPLSQLSFHRKDDYIITSGLVSTIKKIITRKGETMMFVKIEDMVKGIELLIFPRLLKETYDIWQEGAVVIVKGKISEKDDEIKILVDQVGILSQKNIKEDLNQFKKKVLEQKENSFNRYRHKKKEEKKEEKKVEKKKRINPLKLNFLIDSEDLDFKKLKEIFLSFPGENEVYFKVNTEEEMRVIKTAFLVNNSKELRKKINQEFSQVFEIIK